MVLNVVFQDSFGAFLVSTLRQCPRQQRLHHRRLPFAQLHSAIRFFDGLAGLVFLQKNIRKDGMGTPRIGIGLYGALHVRFRVG